MKPFLIVSFLIVAASMLESIVNGQYCTAQASTVDSSTLPKLPNKFQVRVEVKSSGEKSIRDAHIYYDGPKKRTVLRITESNVITRLIYNYDHNEVYAIYEVVEPPSDIWTPPDGRPWYPATCQAYKLSEAHYLNFFGFTMLTADSGKPGEPEYIFRFNPQKNEGKEIISSVVCDKYSSCQYDPQFDANFTAVHYFSDGTYIFAGQNETYNRLPFRATFNGVYGAEGGLKNFAIQHDYHDFSLFIADERVFEIPTGVYCTNKKSTKDIPYVATSFEFSQEITGKSFDITGTRTIRDMYVYNTIITYKYRNHVREDATLNSTEPHQYIVDRQLGVEYAINLNTRECTVRGTKRYSPNSDSDVFTVALDFAAHFQEWYSFLPPQVHFTYNGERKMNGIMSERYIGLVKVTNVSNSIYEYSFSSPNVLFFNLDKSEKEVPVALTIDSDKGERFSSRSSFYNFESEPSSYNRFDVTPCYNSEDVIHFDLVFPYKDIFTVEELANQRYLDRAIYSAISLMTKQALIRFAFPRLTIASDGNLYARSAVFPLPPPQSLFTFEGNFLLLIGSLNSSFRINNTDDCMRFCLTNVKCLSVDFNEATTTCYLNSNSSASGAPTSSSTAFKHYRRNGPGLELLEGFEIFYILNGLVESGSISLELISDDGKTLKDKTLKAEKLNVVSGTNNRFGTTALLSRFNLKSSRTKIVTLKNVEERLGVSVDDCAKLCIDKIGAECKTFGYCYLGADCAISTNSLDEFGPSDFVADDHCDVYEKDPLIHYERLFIKTDINPKDKKFGEIKTASECATKCDNEKGIHCKSFNWCRGTNLCYLSEAHLLDSTAQTGPIDDLSCEHYSRNYVQDFTYVSTGETILDAEVVLKNTDLNGCGTTCVTTHGFNCKTFDYCPETKTCLLNSGESQKVTNPQSGTDKCAHYRREYYYTTSQTYNYRSGGGSDAVLISLSIIFSILSVAGGVVGTFYVFKKYNFIK